MNWNERKNEKLIPDVRLGLLWMKTTPNSSSWLPFSKLPPVVVATMQNWNFKQRPQLGLKLNIQFCFSDYVYIDLRINVERKL